MVESVDIAVVQRYTHFSMESMKLHHELRTIPVLDSNSSDCGLFLNMMQDTYKTATIPLIGWIGMVIFGTLFSTTSLSSLSIRRSLKELFMERHSRLDILDVFRVIAIIWVMINHTGSEGRVDILDRLPSAENFKKAVHEHPIFGPLLGNSALGVEIFLVLSGLLGARSWLRRGDEPFVKHYIKFIARRILRLAPSIFFFVYIAAGPIMKHLLPRYHSSMISSCGFWGIASHLTFLGNWQTTPTCMGYLWYLGLDMQLYVAAPFFLHLLHNKQQTAIAVFISAILGSTAIRAMYCTAYDVCNNSDVDIPFISYPDQDSTALAKIYSGLWEMYARPYTKCGPFLIGLLMGFYTMSAKLKLSTKASSILFTLFFILAITTIYAILPEYWYPDQGTTVYNTLYTALFRTVFAISVVGMIFAVVYRIESVSYSVWWSVLARLTYNAYLLHMPVIYIFNFLPYLQNAQGAHELLVVLPAVAAMSFGAATIFYLFVEAPLGHVLSIWASRYGL